MSKFYYCKLIVFFFLFVYLLNSVSSGANKRKKPFIPEISDSRLLKQEPGTSFKMPKHIFTPRIVKLFHKYRGKDSPVFAPFWFPKGNESRAKKWLKIKPEQWKELIIEMAPISLAGGIGGMTMGICPLCGKPFMLDIRPEYPNDTIIDLINTPFQARTQCCGKIIYAREEDMPPGYPKPNHIEKIPHLDGTVHDYPMYVPKGSEYNKKNWFCPAGEVWACRIMIIIGRVIPDLEAAVLWNDDQDCSRQLAIILDRLADVYPGLPLYDRSHPHGLARGRDRVSYLKREEYLSVDRPFKFGWSFYYDRSHGYIYNLSKLQGGFQGWHDGVVAQVGVLCEAFDLIRHRPEVKEYSKEKYGNPDAWEKRVMERLIKEAWLEATGSGDTRGNTVYNWIYGAIKLGIVYKDKWLFNTALGKIENWIVNGYFSDGLCTEGSSNYSAMMRNLITNIWMIKEFGGVDVRKNHPLLWEIEKGDYPVVTVAGIESQHADEFSTFITCGGGRTPRERDYARAERSQNYPEYGLVCLRGGAPGHRIENIVAYQTAVGHTHFDRLSLQLFFEGLRICPDMGYGVTVADITRAPLKDLKYPYPLMKNPIPNDRWGGLRRTCTMPSESHILVQVDGTADKQRGPCTFHRFQGGEPFEHPAYSVQYWEGSAEPVFSKHPTPVSLYRRQLITITPPGGRAFLVDIFRVKGGKVHDMFWHFSSDDPVTTLGNPKKISAKNLAEYFKEDKIGAMVLENLVKWEVPNNVFKATWEVEPHKYNAVTPVGKEKLKRWLEVLPVAKVNLWGKALGPEPVHKEIVGAKGPFVARMTESVNGKNVMGEGAIAFKGAMNYLIERRKIEKPGLESTFVHVVEPYHVNEEPYISAVDIKDSTDNGSPSSVVLKIKCLSSSNKWDRGLIRVAATMDGGRAEGYGITLEGRLGVAGELKDYWGIDSYANLLYLYDGTKLNTDKLSVEMEPGWEMKLLAVSGDLTGTPGESALIVESNRPLPIDGALAGQMLTVYHQISTYHSNGYTIKSIQPWGENRFRINLKGHPTFIQEWHRVRRIDKDNPRKIFCYEPPYKGQATGGYKGRRIRFPQSSFDCALAGVIPTNTRDLVLLAEGVTYTPDQIRVDDPFIVYSIQPGDRVVIPSVFSAREHIYTQPKLWARTKIKVWDIYTTGEAKITINRPISHVERAGDEEWLFVKGESNKDGSYTIYLQRKDLNNGRVTIYLRDI